MAIPEGGTPTGPALDPALGAGLGSTVGSDADGVTELVDAAAVGAVAVDAAAEAVGAAPAEGDRPGAYVKSGAFGALAQEPSMNATAARRTARRRSRAS